MKEQKRNLMKEILIGIFISLIYLQATSAEDTDITHIFSITLSYVLLKYVADYVDINPDLITNAFITKTIFTIIDVRLK